MNQKNTSRQLRNSNNSSGITAENSKIIFQKVKVPPRLPNNLPSPKYLNSSVFESKTFSTSREKTPKRIKSELYLTDTGETKESEIKYFLSDNLKSNDDIDFKKEKMKEIFGFKPDKLGNILPSIRRKPPTMVYCCDEKFSREKLSELYMKYFVSPPKKLNSLNFKNEKVKVKDTSEDYIEKTKSIILSRYTLKIRKEAADRIERNIKKEIKGLDETMEKIKIYQSTLENNFINKYNDALKQLNVQMEQERIKNDELNFKLNRVLKDVNSLNNQITKKESIKNGIEKWIIFQIEMRQKKIPINIKETLKNDFNNDLIFGSIDEFEEWFVNEENKNLKLLKQFQQKYSEKEKLENEFEEFKKYERYVIEIEKEEQEKEKLLTLLKLRNSKLEKEKIETTKYVHLHSYKKKRTYSMNDIPKKLKDNLYIKVKSIYIHIKEKIKSSEFDFTEIENEVKHTNNREAKILKMLNGIEQIINYLLTKFSEYKNNKKYISILKEIQASIDFEHKKENARKNKMEEEKKITDLRERINRRNNKIIYVPLRKVDNYPFTLFVKPKVIVNEKDKNKELSLSDFLYDK